MRSFWSIIGVLLLAWVAWDLYAGYTFLLDIVYKELEPTKYWVCIGAWALLGISCFFSWNNEEK